MSDQQRANLIKTMESVARCGHVGVTTHRRMWNTIPCELQGNGVTYYVTERLEPCGSKVALVSVEPVEPS